MLPFGYFSINGDLYARGLGQALRTQRLYDQDQALAKDPAVYERLRLDPVISFAIRLRKLLASGTDWYLEAASTSDQDRLLLKIMEELVSQIEQFTMARFNLAEAIIAGSRWAKIEGEERELEIPGCPKMKWWVPVRLRDVDKRRLRQQSITPATEMRDVMFRDPNGKLTETKVPFQKKEWVWQIYRPVNQVWEDIDRDEYVRHVNDDREDTLGFGGGLASELYTYWYSKEIVLQHGLQYLDRWAQGLVVAHVNSLRDGQASAPASADRLTQWLNVLRTCRTQHAVIADALDRVEVIDAPTGGWTAAMQALEYLDGSMRVCILGASLPTAKDSKGGSYAMAEVQQGVSDLLGRFDRTSLDETIRRDLLGWCMRKNWANLLNMGLTKCHLPHMRIREDRREDHEVRANVLLKARQANMAIRQDEAYAQLGFSPPAQDEAGNYLDPVLDTLAESESSRQSGQPKPAVSGKADALKSAKENNPVRPGEEPGEPGKPREAAADHIGGAFSTHTFSPQPITFSPEITVNVPENKAPNVTVNVPKQDAPNVHVSNFVPERKVEVINNMPKMTSNVDVNIPDTFVPDVTVNVPERQINVAIPEREVKIDVDVNMPKPGEKKIEVTRNRQGQIESLDVKTQE